VNLVKPFVLYGETDTPPMGYSFFCPGCVSRHIVYTREPNSRGAKWTFNGDLSKPTFRPSVATNMANPSTRCHLFITDGIIQFLPDCAHALAGKMEMMTEEVE